MRKANPSFVVAALVSLSILLTAPLEAQGPDQSGGAGIIQRAYETYAQADFEVAGALFSRLTQSEGLTRRQLARVFEGKALVALALGQEAEVDHALDALYSLEPNYTLGDFAPPRLRTRFEERGAGGEPGLELRVRVSPARGGVRVEAEAVGDTAGLVQRVQVVGRLGEGASSQGNEGALFIAGEHGHTLTYRAEALSAGGVLLVEEEQVLGRQAPVGEAEGIGQPGDPAWWVEEGPGEAPAVAPSAGLSRGWRRALWVGAAVVLVAGGTAGVWLATRPEDTVVQRPGIRF